MRTAIVTLAFLIPVICFSQDKAKYATTVLINGKFTGYAVVTQSEAFKALGKPDRVIPNPAQCGSLFDSADSLALFKDVVFEMAEGRMEFSRISFTDNSKDFIQLDNIKLTSKTTLEEIEKRYESGNRDTRELDDNVSGKKVRIFDIDVTPEANDGQKWYLIFYRGKLIRLEMWVAC